ncbi:MAG: type II secretion system minor pseudopilin GspJ [Parvularculaceae bacterium]
MNLRSAGKEKRGFTLVEMLIALLVFSIVSAAAIAVMRISIVSKERIDAASGRIGDIQIARSLMKADFAQAVSRPARDEFGNEEPAFAGGAPAVGGDALVALTRAGWINPGGAAARASLQRVEYVFREDVLIRRTRTYLDQGAGAAETETRLLDGLERVEFSFNIGPGEWSDEFRAAAVADFPRAVRLRSWFKGADAPLTLMFLMPAELE